MGGNCGGEKHVETPQKTSFRRGETAMGRNCGLLFSERFFSPRRKYAKKGKGTYHFGEAREALRIRSRAVSPNVKELGFAVAGSLLESGDFFLVCTYVDL